MDHDVAASRVWIAEQRWPRPGPAYRRAGGRSRPLSSARHKLERAGRRSRSTTRWSFPAPDWPRRRLLSAQPGSDRSGPTRTTRAVSLPRSTTAARSGWRSTPGCCRCGRTCRDSPGPAADSGNNPCRRQADVVVVACPTGVQERRLPSSVTGETPFVVAGSRAWRALQSGSAKPRTGRCGAAAEMPEEGLEPPTRGL
jgi:hypothetical protein